jgi:hypothetical protein
MFAILAYPAYLTTTNVVIRLMYHTVFIRPFFRASGAILQSPSFIVSTLTAFLAL